MIIFGTKARTKTIDSGTFFCPRCQTTRHYELKKAKNYFALYFIPIIPMNDLGEFVECQTCRTTFDAQVLTMPQAEKPKRGQTLAEMLNTIKPQLENGLPIEYLLRDLTGAGLDRDVALTTMDAAIGKERRVCPTCGLTYAAAVSNCSEDDTPLAADRNRTNA